MNRRGTTLSDGQRELLIRMVHERKYLWSKDDPDRNDRILNDKAWKEIADQVGTDVRNARRKWRNLKDIFGRSKKTHERQVAEGTATGDPKWPFWRQMQFITSQDENDIEQNADDGRFDSESIHSATVDNSESLNVDSSIDLSRVKHEKLEEVLFNAIQNGQRGVATSLGKRKYSSAFGDYVEERLSMLPLGVRLDAEHEICNILRVKLQETDVAGLLTHA